MGEAGGAVFEPSFNRAIKVRSRDDRLTSNAGALLLREADERLGLISSLCKTLEDPRAEARVRYTLEELLRERVYALALGYWATDDCDVLAHDPAMRMASWDRPGDRVRGERLASQPTQSRLLYALGEAPNREALCAGLADWSERHQFAAQGDNRPIERGTIDVDGVPIDVHGGQEGGAYNGYYRRSIYSPYVASFAPNGDYDDRQVGDGFVGGMLRPGNAGSHEDALEFLRTTRYRCSRRAKDLDFRLDAGFTVAEVLDGLTDDGTRFVGRLRSNPVLERLAEPHLRRPVGRPPLEGYEYTVELGEHRASTWKHAQRVVLCVVDKPDPVSGQLEILPRYFYLVTSWKRHEMSARRLLEHYRRRGTFEDRLGELERSIRPRLSSPAFQENEVSLLLALLAFNLVNILRGELELANATGWDLRRVQTSVLKAAARVVTGSRRLFVDVAESAIALWKPLCARMQRWTLPTALYSRPSPPTRRPWVSSPSHAHTSLVLRN